MSKVIQLKEFLHLLNVKSLEECERVAAEILHVIVYLQPGDRFETSSLSIEKLDDSLFYVHTEIDERRLLDAMETKMVLKLPV